MATTDLGVRVRTDVGAAEWDRFRKGQPAFTQFAYTQRTRGTGFTTIFVPFDVTFANEPVFSYGCSLVAIDTPGFLPSGGAIVLRWLRSDRHTYLGAQVTLTAEAKLALGYTTTGQLLAGEDLGSGVHATPVIAHHLAFAGVGHMPTKADTATKAQHSQPKETAVG